MHFFPDGKTFLEINIGGLQLHIAWYALLILTGAILAYYLSQKQAKKLGYEKELLEDYFFTMLPLAIVGARLYYCLFAWDYYGQDLIRIFYIWEGGLAIHGGLITGIVYSYFYFRFKGVNLLRIGDCILPNVLIAQVIRRWGNFMNQEAFGNIVPASYFDHFPDFIKNKMFIDGFYRQPMFLYEGIGNLIAFIFVKTIFKKYGYKKRGDMVYAYLTWYGIVRFFIEIFRSDALMAGTIRIAQVVSILFIVLGLLGYVGVYNRIFHSWYPFKKEKPIVLFDADGTLVDSEKLIKDSFRYTFAHFLPDYHLKEEELDSFLGPALRDTFEKYLPKEKVDAAVQYYRVYNHAHHDQEVNGMLHAKELVRNLKKHGYCVGVVSNKMSDLVRRGLRCAEIEELMDVVVGRDQINAAKPNPEGIKKACELARYPIDDVVYVGDAPGDIQVAKNIGAYSIAFAKNTQRKAILEKEKPNRIVSDLMEIEEIVKEDLEWNVFVM